MTTLSTHDTKRQEDVRARLAVLAEWPEEWAHQVAEWRGLALWLTDGAAAQATERAPDPDLDYLMWQTLVGAWLIGSERLRGYLRKAMHEAKTRTSWTMPNAAYESAVLGLADALLADPELTAGIAGFVARIAPDARVNSLGAKLVQLTMPGVADVYQGCELTGLSLWIRITAGRLTTAAAGGCSRPCRPTRTRRPASTRRNSSSRPARCG